MPFSVIRELPYVFHLICSLCNLLNHKVPLDGLAGAGPISPTAVVSDQNWLLEFPVPVGQPPFEDYLGRGLKAFLPGQVQALANVQIISAGNFPYVFHPSIHFQNFR